MIEHIGWQTSLALAAQLATTAGQIAAAQGESCISVSKLPDQWEHHSRRGEEHTAAELKLHPRVSDNWSSRMRTQLAGCNASV